MIKPQSRHLRRTPQETGQAIVIIALGFVVLLGFTGLVVDVARVFVARGNLRRAVDAAGLAAAAQFRQNAPLSYIQTSATQFIYAHGIVNDPTTFADMSVITSTIHVMTCDTTPALDASLCTALPRRKLVHIDATANVAMSFLQIVGIGNVQVTAESTSEAAAVDVVLVLDASIAQAYDPPSMDAYASRSDLGCDPTSLGVIGQDGSLYGNACAAACNQNPSKPCYPFKKIKDAAKAFIDQLYQNYDRVAIVRIDREPEVVFPLSTNLQGAKDAIDDPNLMYVSDRFPGDAHGNPCMYITVSGQRWRCTTSNMGGALLMAGDQFRTPPFRDDSLWVIVMLSSSSGDSTDQIASSDPDSALFGFCPNKDTQPFCRDNRWLTHHISTTAQYDAEDYAYDGANYLGLLPQKDFTGAPYFIPGSENGGAGILIFTIGLGRKVVCTGAYTTYNPGPPVTCVPAGGSPFVDPSTGYPNGAESFLRYVAAVGDDGDPATDPCTGAVLGASCGNYYFAPDADQLQRIFLTIAGKIFTRLAG
ncbi:MAG: vWA domain-containing protein [Anaerolineae bacterium]